MRACDQGHVVHYPETLDATAIESMRELAFCSTCECGTVHFVVVWAGDRTRVMASGGPEVFEKFEAQTWPGATHTDELGTFFYRVIDNPLAVTLFTS